MKRNGQGYMNGIKRE